MKILYIAQDGDDSRAWAGSPDAAGSGPRAIWTPALDAARWIRDDPGNALVVEGLEPAGLLDQVRATGLALEAVPLDVSGGELPGALSAAALMTTEATWALGEEVRALASRCEAAERTLEDERTAHEAALSRTTTLAGALQVRLMELERSLDSASERAAGTDAELRRLRRQAADEQSAASERIARLQEELAAQHAARAGLEAQLTAADRAWRDAAARHDAEVRQQALRVQQAAEEHARALARSTRICTALQERLLELEGEIEQERRSAAERLVVIQEGARKGEELHAALTHALAERADLEGRLAAAERALRDQQQRAAAERDAALGRQALLEQQIALAGVEAARLQHEAEAARRQAEVFRRHRDRWRHEAERLPAVQMELDSARKDVRRQFERAPYGLLDCAPDGTIKRVNHVFAISLGYRRPADLAAVDTGTAVFECPGDLRWLLERAQRSGKAQSVDTTLATRDRHRRFVRLHAISSDGSILVGVEDMTSLRALEDRLRESQRLEAVGRVAAEVSVTCATLLQDVADRGGQLLQELGAGTRARREGELLLEDVGRAAGFLRQVAGHEAWQAAGHGPVSLTRVLHDMAPVLKRVLGDDIDLSVPKSMRRPDAFDVAVDAPRLERILVQVANYARTRMALGGRMRIQLGSTVVDRRFLARHPWVRSGAHVVLTVAEAPAAVWPALPISWRPAGSPPDGVRRASRPDAPIDLGPLVALIGDCGGHLWMSAEATGGMTLRIHLPKRVQDVVDEPAAPAWSERRRQLAGWFGR